MEHISRNLRVVSLCTVVSRVLGMVRDACMAAMFGAGPVLDAFTLAFRIPNLARSMLGEGAVATAFLPVLVGEMQHGGVKAASRLATALFLVLATALSLIVGVAELGLWWWGRTHALTSEGELLRQLTALTLPYVILVCLTAQMATLLHASREFLWPALVPVVFNLVWLASLWLVVPQWTDAIGQIMAMSVCVVIAGSAQLLFPVPAAIWLGYRPAADWRNALHRVGEIFRHVMPVLLGLSITQINTIMDSVVAWGLSKPDTGPDAIDWLGGIPYPLTAGTTAALYFGQRLYQFPLGVFGVALGTVLYPLLTTHAQRGDWPALRSDFALGMRLVAAVGVPATAGLILLAEPLAAACFEYGRFDAVAARLTAEMIVAYGSGVWAYCGLLIIHRAFYALGDRITPLLVGFGAVFVNFVLNLTLIWWLGGAGLAFATSIAAMLQCGVTAWLLERRLGGLDLTSVQITVGKTLLATAVMYVAGSATLGILQTWPGLSGRAVRVLLPLGVSLGAYFAMTALIRLHEPWDLIRLTRRSEPRAEAHDDSE